MTEAKPFHELSYHLITYGCQMNKNDSERMSGLLENLGYVEADSWQEANLVVVNTCSIRDKAERRVHGKFHELNTYRQRHGKRMELAIMGCMPQHAKVFIRERLGFLDYVVGVNNMEHLPDLLGQGLSLDEQMKRMRVQRRTEDVESYETLLHRHKRAEQKKAWVSIMFGCDKMCSFCIVPFTRGREISRRKERIFSEIADLEEKGVDQVVLLGQNVNSYGKKLYDDYNFSHLLEDVALRFPWLRKIDFLTSYPTDVDDRLIDVIAAHQNITDEIHFPIQHGDDAMLKAMKRHYTVDEYLGKVQKLRKKMPHVRLGTDLIVGFPGETEEQFETMLRTMRLIKFDFANTAMYSPRPRTPAAKMPNQVPDEVKKRRLHVLNRTMEAIVLEKERNGTKALRREATLA